MNKSDTKAIEAMGIRIVKKIVIEKWLSNFQEFSHENDDGIDGEIFLKKKNTDTGGVLFVQIKCGLGYKKSFKKRPDYICVHLGKMHIETHKDRWKRTELPVILIYVEPTKDSNKPKAYWVDLKSDKSYSQENKNIILIPKNQTFNEHTKGDFLKLTGTKSLAHMLPIIELNQEEASIFTLSGSIKQEAREYYKNWGRLELSERFNSTLGEITVNRIGWRHITRPGRKANRIIQSWLLLSTAKKIIKEVENYHRLGRASKKEYAKYSHPRTNDACIKINDYIGIRAKVNFPHRDAAIIQVVLRRMRIISIENPSIIYNKVWFYSVYEKRKIY